MIEVTGLFIYPVKGLRGIALEQAELTSQGLACDRHWMIVMPNGRMVTQRQKPQLATLRTELTGDSLIISLAEQQPLHPSLTVPLQNPVLERIPVTVWRDQFTALDEGAEASDWLTRVLDSSYPLRLVRMADNVKRPQSKPDLLGTQTSTRFADAAPFLVTNEDSLADLNQNLEIAQLDRVPMERFRPNITIKGLAPYGEYCRDCLVEISGRYSIGLCYPSERCVVVNTDQQTGAVDKEGQQPLNTLKQMNTAPGYDGAFFGQNAMLQQGEQQVIRIGDTLSLTSSPEH